MTDSIFNYLLSNPEFTNFIFTELPWWLLLIWFAYSIIVLLIPPLGKYFSNYFVIQSIPNVFVTLGLLGTFTGIAYGLLKFNTQADQIRNSVQILLTGLRSAMFTSISGIILSLLFNKLIKIFYNENSRIVPESAEVKQLKILNENFLTLEETISTSQHNALVESLENAMSDFKGIFSDYIKQLVNDNFEELNKAVSILTIWQKEHKNDVIELKNSYKQLVTKHKGFTKNTEVWVNLLDEIAGQSSKLKTIINEFNSAFQEDGNLSKVVINMNNASKKIKVGAEDFKKNTEGIKKIIEKLESKESKLDDWTKSFTDIYQSTTDIVEKVDTLQRINIGDVQSLIDQYNNSLRASFSSFDKLMKKYIEFLHDKLEDDE